MKDKIKLFSFVILIFAVICVTSIYVSTTAAKNMVSMPENEAIKEYIITNALQDSDLVKIRLIPERSKLGYYLTGELAGRDNGTFVYKVTYAEQSMYFSVDWYAGNGDELVVIEKVAKILPTPPN